MSSSVPSPVIPKSGGYAKEENTFSSITDLFRFFQPKKMKISKHSPPVLGVDISEGEVIWDRTLLRTYTVSDGVLRYSQWT